MSVHFLIFHTSIGRFLWNVFVGAELLPDMHFQFDLVSPNCSKRSIPTHTLRACTTENPVPDISHETIILWICANMTDTKWHLFFLHCVSLNINALFFVAYPYKVLPYSLKTKTPKLLCCFFLLSSVLTLIYMYLHYKIYTYLHHKAWISVVAASSSLACWSV